jgi:hypothetical protein
MEKISKLDQSTPFGGDDNAALIAELKRQGFVHITGEVHNPENGTKHIGVWINDPKGSKMLSPFPVSYTDDKLFNELANRIKTDPLPVYVQGRLEVMTRFLLREIYYVTSNEGDVMRDAERLQTPMWRRCMMIAGKILSLDLGPVHGT